MKAITINTSGERNVVEFTDETCYEMLRTAVGGFIECYHLSGLDVWGNEESKLLAASAIRAETTTAKDLLNAWATERWNDVYGLGSDIILGDVIVTGGIDGEGNTLGLSDEQVEQIMAQRIPSKDEMPYLWDKIGEMLTSMF